MMCYQTRTKRTKKKCLPFFSDFVVRLYYLLLRLYIFQNLRDAKMEQLLSFTSMMGKYNVYLIRVQSY